MDRYTHTSMAMNTSINVSYTYYIDTHTPSRVEMNARF